jgi:hypothetical protein
VFELQVMVLAPTTDLTWEIDAAEFC